MPVMCVCVCMYVCVCVCMYVCINILEKNIAYNNNNNHNYNTNCWWTNRYIHDVWCVMCGVWCVMYDVCLRTAMTSWCCQYSSKSGNPITRTPYNTHTHTHTHTYIIHQTSYIIHHTSYIIHHTSYIIPSGAPSHTTSSARCPPNLAIICCAVACLVISPCRLCVCVYICVFVCVCLCVSMNIIVIIIIIILCL